MSCATALQQVVHASPSGFRREYWPQKCISVERHGNDNRTGACVGKLPTVRSHDARLRYKRLKLVVRGYRHAVHSKWRHTDGQKSWFMFDNEIVSLGAGTTSTDNKVVESIVENRKLNNNGNNALQVNGFAKSTALGWKETLTGVNRIHLAGNVAGPDIGIKIKDQVIFYEWRLILESEINIFVDGGLQCQHLI